MKLEKEDEAVSSTTPMLVAPSSNPHMQPTSSHMSVPPPMPIHHEPTMKVSRDFVSRRPRPISFYERLNFLQRSQGFNFSSRPSQCRRCQTSCLRTQDCPHSRRYRRCTPRFPPRCHQDSLHRCPRRSRPVSRQAFMTPPARSELR